MKRRNATVIFDFDGTLFQTEQLAIPSFLKTFDQLINEGYSIDSIPSETKMLSVIGMTLDKIWDTLLPNLSKKLIIKQTYICFKMN
ncbi:HAD hydrolase-like protein [Tepidibacillus marianensis]|uniref:HAD hydrolase-like protein n=1 Tax=Tepidibacillus marianensis TaxID=3131995 RepID=UPI0030CFA43B